MKKIVIGRHGFKCAEETENEYMLSTYGVCADGKFRMGEINKEKVIKENRFYKIRQWHYCKDELIVFCFIHNDKLVVGECCKDENGNRYACYYDMEEEDVENIPEDIQKKAISYCNHNCKEEYAEF